MLWKDLRKRVAGGKRAAINAALADFEAAGGQLACATSCARRSAWTAASERRSSSSFPSALAGYKDLYIGFVRFDPMDDIREAGDAKRMRKKWEATCEQIATLVDKIHDSSKDFHDTGLASEDGAAAAGGAEEGEEGRREAARRGREGPVDAAAERRGRGARAARRHRAELEEKIRNLKRDIDSMHAVEENDFKAWEEVLDSFHLV
jgi:hypothetical protein